MIDKDNKGIVNLDAANSPAILASLLDISKSSIYEARTDGKLPPNTDATYRQCIQFYCNYWKMRAGGKASSIAEAALAQKIQLDMAKTEREWLDIKEKKGELVDVKVMAELFEPAFLHIRTMLVSLSRKFPEIAEEVDRGLDELHHLGDRVLASGRADMDTFIETKMLETFELAEPEDVALNRFEDD